MNSKSADGLGTQLRRLLELLDGDVEAIYRSSLPGYVPRYTPIMKALADGEPKSIKAIAERSSVSHSAASQTIARMTKLGLVVSRADEDSRYRLISLTAEGEALLPDLQRQWQATNQAAAGLEQDTGFPLSEVLGAAIEQLEAASFRSRIETIMRKKQ